MVVRRSQSGMKTQNFSQRDKYLIRLKYFSGLMPISSGFRMRHFFMIGLTWCLALGQVAQAQNGAARLPLEHGWLWNEEAEKYRQTGIRPHHTAVKPALGLAISPDSVHEKATWLTKKLFHEHLINQKTENWQISISPLADMRPGIDLATGRGVSLWNYGLMMQIELGSKWHLHTEAYNGWSIFPAYLDSFINSSGVVPGQGLARTGTRPLQYQNAATHVVYRPNEWFNLQFGQDKNFIGDGYRSLILSDAAFPMPYARAQLTLGPLQYTYFLMQMLDTRTPPLSWNLGYRQKYNAMGHLNWQINDRWQLGATQAVVWQADDSLGGKRPFPWQYLNPLIFYWPIQFSSGSEGNLLLALSSSYQLGSWGMLYGQFVIDEMKLGFFAKQNGSIANKYSGQLGWKKYDVFGLKNWVMLAELNMVRPFTYSHWSPLTNYAHLGQSLAHPAGANFRELLFINRLPLNKRWEVDSRVIFTQLGRDTSDLALGQDIFKDFRTYPGGIDGTGIFIGNGLKAHSWHLENSLSFLINPKTNLRAELRWIYRYEDMTVSQRTTHWVMIGIRSQLRNLYYDF
jgi:hypothetical protein